MSTGLIHLLRVVHVLSTSFWFGAALINVFFLVPSVRALGPAAGGPFMRQIVHERKMPIYINGSAVLAVLSGLTLYWWRSSGFQGEWMGTTSGIVFGIGGLSGVCALLLALLVIGPTAGRLGALAAAGGGPPTPEVAAEIQRLQQKMALVSKFAIVFIVTAALCMAIGRYV